MATAVPPAGRPPETPLNTRTQLKETCSLGELSRRSFIQQLAQVSCPCPSPSPLPIPSHATQPAVFVSKQWGDAKCLRKLHAQVGTDVFFSESDSEVRTVRQHKLRTKQLSQRAEAQDQGSPERSSPFLTQGVLLSWGSAKPRRGRYTTVGSHQKHRLK